MTDLKPDFNKNVENQGGISNQEKYGNEIANMAGEEEQESKISLIEIFFITPFYLLSDTIDLTLFLTGIDDFGIMDTVRTSISQFYFVMIKKMGAEIWATNLVINAVKLIPYVGELIPSTLFWFVVILIDKGALKKFKKFSESGVGGKILENITEKVSKTATKI